jgi:hypothetical protein
MGVSFRLAIASTIAIVTIVPAYLLGYIKDIPVTINGQDVVSADVPTKIVVGLAAIGTLFFAYAIYLLRKTIGFFKKRDIFNEDVIRYFGGIGKCVLASTILTNIPMFFYNTIHLGHVSSLSLNGGGFSSLLLSLSLGLFFMVLGEVFKIAKNLKEENDLTL